MKRLVLAFVSAAAALTALAQLSDPTDAEMEASVLNEGNAARLENVFERASRGETISIVAIGGSITEGAGAGGAANRWGDLVTDWFARAFPRTTVKRRNAGIGATGSALGAYRISRDVAAARPNLVLVDFSVNDPSGKRCGETFEGCIRQILRLERAPAVLVVSMVRENGTNAQDEHLEVARHYQLPHLSVRNVINARIARKEIVWRDYSADAIHPNVAGHRFVASLVGMFLDRKMRAWRDGTRSAAWTFPARPLFGTTFDNGRVISAPELRPTENRGFVPGAVRHGWPAVLTATNAGARLVFETDAATLSLLHWRLHADYGRAKVSVDGHPAAVLEGWFEKTWGGYAQATLIYRDCPGRHRVEIEILDEKDEHSNGRRFELCAVLEQEKEIGSGEHVAMVQNGEDK